MVGLIQSCEEQKMKDDVISIVINLDTRPGLFNETTLADVMLKGTRSVDFLIDGVINKDIFFQGFETEIIMFIDVHEPIPQPVMDRLNSIADVVVLSRHREFFNHCDYFPKWNDINYLQAISLARGKYIAHFDGDTAAFINDPTIIQEWKDSVNSGKCDYISYPSHWSPYPAVDERFDYTWASTRFFFCRKDIIKYDEITKCLSDSNYLYEKYPASVHCPWLEHVLGLIDRKVVYPPMQMDRYMIFSWSSYRKGLLAKLQGIPYSSVRKFVEDRGGISYPNDVQGAL